MLRHVIIQLVRKAVALGAVTVATTFAAELSPTGFWKTIDDHSGRPRGAVQIYEKGGVFFGKVEAAFDPREAAERCRRCRDDRKDKPIIGLTITPSFNSSR